jgi:tRNA modification GTPase
VAGMNVISNDPIVALATASGRSALGIVRMTGADVWTITANACGHTNIPDDWIPQHARLVRILSVDGNPLDEGVLLPWRGPHSSTGDDVIEFIGHGSPAGLELVVERFVELGARPAQPGEFTRRAFLNGKLTLDQAESIASYIDAKTSAAARASLRVLLGGLKTQIATIQGSLEDSLGLVELELDFTEEDVEVFNRKAFSDSTSSIIRQLEQLLKQAHASKYLRNGIHVVLAGETNVGKSTLFNALLGQDRAIVSQTPGTTRDYLDAAVEWSGVPVRLVDTAGIRESSEDIEQEGIRRSWSLLDQADVLLWLVAPRDYVLPTENLLNDDRLVLVRAKSDLADGSRDPLQHPTSASVSALSGYGLDDLKKLILDHVLQGASIDDSLGLEQRHTRLIETTLEALRQSIQLAEQGESEEVIAVELRIALDSLSEITGKVTGEDVLNRIFGRFCIGK